MMVRLVSPDPLDSPISLGTDENGITFTLLTDGRVGINLWDSNWDEAGSVTLDADHSLTLAQWINHQLKRD